MEGHEMTNEQINIAAANKPMKSKKNSNSERAGVAVDAPVRAFWCIEQQPTLKELGQCTVSVQHNGMALLMDADGRRAIRRMERAQIDWMHADGFMVSGFEEITRAGKPVFVRQEWFCRYANAV
jgi:hypothetical protein